MPRKPKFLASTKNLEIEQIVLVLQYVVMGFDRLRQKSVILWTKSRDKTDERMKQTKSLMNYVYK